MASRYLGTSAVDVGPRASGSGRSLQRLFVTRVVARLWERLSCQARPCRFQIAERYVRQYTAAAMSVAISGLALQMSVSPSKLAEAGNAARTNDAATPGLRPSRKRTTCIPFRRFPRVCPVADIAQVS